MKFRFTSNNVFATLIAIMLIAAGFVLSFMNRQSMTADDQETATEIVPAPAPEPTAAYTEVKRTTKESLSRVALDSKKLASSVRATH